MGSFFEGVLPFKSMERSAHLSSSWRRRLLEIQINTSSLQIQYYMHEINLRCGPNLHQSAVYQIRFRNPLTFRGFARQQHMLFQKCLRQNIQSLTTYVVSLVKYKITWSCSSNANCQILTHSNTNIQPDTRLNSSNDYIVGRNII